MYWTPNNNGPHTRQVVWCKQDEALHFADVYPVLKVNKAPTDVPALRVGFQNGLTNGFAHFEHPDQSERAYQFISSDDILNDPDAARLLNLPAQPNSKPRGWQAEKGMLVLAKSPQPGHTEFYPAEIAKAFVGSSVQVRFLCPSNIPFPHLNGEAQPIMDRSNLEALDQGSALKVHSIGRTRRCSVVHPRNTFGSVTFTELIYPADLAHTVAAAQNQGPAAANTLAPMCAADASVHEKRECKCEGCGNCDEDSSHRSVQLDQSAMASGLCKECQYLA